jgi:predicted acylesterase/phospholipase RssA
VLDRLLEEPWIKIEAISGTSAGAMNAAVLVDGWSRGGADGARAALDAYWRRVSRAAAFSPLQRSPLERLMGRWTLDTSPAYLAIDLMSRVFSPYDLNPMGFNPLRQILAESIDFERLVASPIKLFITATNVHTGRGRIFRNSQITPDVLLASACLPTMFQAVEIEGEAYWDGGFAGNPTITPLVRESDAHDTILVQIARAADYAEDGGRYPRPTQRDFLQLASHEGTAHDRLAAPGRRSRTWRGCALGEHANPQHHDRQAGRIRRVVEAKCRMGIPRNAQGGGPEERRRFPDPSWRRSRQQVERRSRRAAGGVLTV